MLKVICAQDTLHQHVVNIDFYCASDQILENLVNHALEGSPGIFEPERHHLTEINPPISSESSIILIWWVHLDLIVSGVGVHDLRSSWLIIASTNLSILQSGKLSFGQASLRLVKSMQTLYLPFFFFTRTGLESQSGRMSL